MTKYLQTLVRVVLLMTAGAAVSSCDPQVYGSVGIGTSSWNGGGPHMRGSISVGGRICC